MSISCETGTRRQSHEKRPNPAWIQPGLITGKNNGDRKSRDRASAGCRRPKVIRSFRWWRLKGLESEFQDGIATNMTMARRKVTVFGGTGFLGQRVVQHLLEHDFSVRVAVRHPERIAALFPDVQLDAIQADINDDRSVAAAVAGVEAS